MRLRIAHVTYHGCIRALKIGYAQMGQGYECHLISWNHSPCHQFYDLSGFKTVHFFDPALFGPNQIYTNQLIESCRMLEPVVDLFHVHNEPNWLFRVVRDAVKKPVIFDIHDWSSLRKEHPSPPFELEAEQDALAHADGFCVVSLGYLKRLRTITNKPICQVYSMVPRALFPTEQWPLKAGLVYEGGVKGKNDLFYNYPYRNWSQWAHKAAQSLNQDQKIYFYTSNNGEDLADYNHPSIEYYPPQNYSDLLAMMTQYSAGLVGSPYPLTDFEDSMPNKLFEYLASGIPCVVSYAPEALTFVQYHGVGKGVSDPSELGTVLATFQDHQVKSDRYGFTMESQLPKLEALYAQVLDQHAPRSIDQRVLFPQAMALVSGGTEHVSATEGIQGTRAA